MVWVVLILLAVAVAAVAAALIAGRLPYDPMADPVHSTPDTGLPEDPGAADVDAVRFDTAARGYRMSEVDDVLDALQTRLATQERELADLRAERPPTAADEPRSGRAEATRDTAEATSDTAEATSDTAEVERPRAASHGPDERG